MFSVLMLKVIATLLIIAQSILGGFAYARYLNTIHHKYAPDHIDLTVVFGVGFIVLTCLELAFFDVVFTYEAVAALFLACLLWSIGILWWQSNQRAERRQADEAARREVEGS